MIVQPLFEVKGKTALREVTAKGPHRVQVDARPSACGGYVELRVFNSAGRQLFELLFSRPGGAMMAGLLAAASGVSYVTATGMAVVRHEPVTNDGVTATTLGPPGSKPFKPSVPSKKHRAKKGGA